MVNRGSTAGGMAVDKVRGHRHGGKGGGGGDGDDEEEDESSRLVHLLIGIVRRTLTTHYTFPPSKSYCGVSAVSTAENCRNVLTSRLFSL